MIMDKCPTCHQKVKVIRKECCPMCSAPHYEPLPQPDLTRLRDVYEKYKHNDKTYSDRSRWHALLKAEALPDLWQAIKEVLDEQNKV